MRQRESNHRRNERRQHEQDYGQYEAHWGGPHAGRRGMGRRGGPFWFGPGRRPPFGPEGPGDPFGDWPSGRGGPRRRQRRGDIKFALLELLAEQPRHGYELIKELERRYAGFYRPSPGSVYPTLQLLEDEGHLSSEVVEGRRVYAITESGRHLLAERQAGLPRPGMHPEESGAELGELRQSAGALLGSVMQAARHGTPEQVRAVGRILDQARREVYAVLADADQHQKDS